MTYEMIGGLISTTLFALLIAAVAYDFSKHRGGNAKLIGIIGFFGVFILKGIISLIR